MKGVIIGLVCLMLAGPTFAEQDPLKKIRTFTSADGRSIKGRIVKYDATRKKVYFERENGKKMWIAPVAFSQDGQDFIKEWMVADLFLSESKLKIKIQEVEMGNGRPLQSFSGIPSAEDKKIKTIYYKITIQNNTGIEIDCERIDFCCCIEQEGWNGSRDREDWFSGHVATSSLKEGKTAFHVGRISLETVHKIREQRDQYGRKSTSREKAWEERIRGTLFKLYGPKLEGIPVVREVCNPESFGQKNQWPDENHVEELSSQKTVENESPKRVSRIGQTPANAEEYKKWFGEITSKFYPRYSPGTGKLMSEKITRAEAHLLYEELAALYDPQYETEKADYIRRLGECASLVREYKAAADCYEKVLKAVGESRSLRMVLSGLYTCEDAEARNGAKAVEHAKVVLASDKKSHAYMTLLARGYACDGQYKLAVKYQRDAISRLSKTKKGYQLKEYEKRLKLYKQGSPSYYEPPKGMFF